MRLIEKPTLLEQMRQALTDLYARGREPQCFVLTDREYATFRRQYIEQAISSGPRWAPPGQLEFDGVPVFKNSQVHEELRHP